MLPQTTTFRRLADCMLLLDPLLYFTEALRVLRGRQRVARSQVRLWISTSQVRQKHLQICKM